MFHFNKKSTIMTVTVGGFLALTGPANAATMSCTTTGPGNSAATLSLTDALNAACFNGNDSNDIGSTFSIFGLTNWILADKNDDVSSGDQSITFNSGVVNGSTSGAWGLTSLGSASSVIINLKAGNGWGSFLVDTTSGTWASSKDLSHASIYYQPLTPVPLPAAGWLLLAGLGGLAAAKRRKKA